jgi:hypothetical protein
MSEASARPSTRPSRRATSRPLSRIALLLAAGLTVTGLTACSTDSQAAEDAYKIGCPALDAAVAGGTVMNQAAIRGLQAIHDSGQLDPEPTRWVETAIAVLTDPGEIPDDAKKLLIDGCTEHGYTLQNLK